LFDFSFEGKIKITGKGRISFIDAIVSNDVENLKDHNGVYAAFLNNLGKVLSDCIIYKFNDFLLINTSFIGKQNIIDKLNSECKLGKSEVDDNSMKYALFSLQGPKSTALISKLFNIKIKLTKRFQFVINEIAIDPTTDNNNDNSNAEIFIMNNQRTTEIGYDIFVPASVYKEFKELILHLGKKLNLRSIKNDVYDVLRLEAKIPLYGIDFDQKNILNEITEKATNYDKGCFIGQEIVARIKNIAHGLTAKKLVSLEIDGKEVPQHNSKIMKDDMAVGFITSAAFSPTLKKVVAFGFLKKGFYENKTTFKINGSDAIYTKSLSS